MIRQTLAAWFRIWTQFLQRERVGETSKKGVKMRPHFCRLFLTAFDWTKVACSKFKTFWAWLEFVKLEIFDCDGFKRATARENYSIEKVLPQLASSVTSYLHLPGWLGVIHKYLLGYLWMIPMMCDFYQGNVIFIRLLSFVMKFASRVTLSVNSSIDTSLW